jgi:hypothetical protein
MDNVGRDTDGSVRGFDHVHYLATIIAVVNRFVLRILTQRETWPILGRMEKTRPLESTLRANLMAVADVYIQHTGLARATLSRRMHGNDDFLDQFESGRCSVTVSKYQDMLLWLSHHWPTGARWPSTATVRIKKTAGKAAAA